MASASNRCPFPSCQRPLHRDPSSGIGTPPPLERRDVPHGGRPQAVACTAESVLSPTECERLIAITEAQGYEKALVNVGGGRQRGVWFVIQFSCKKVQVLKHPLFISRVRSRATPRHGIAARRRVRGRVEGRPDL